MYISDIKNGEYARILKVEEYRLFYNADSAPGTSGSPVISRESNQLIGLHRGSDGARNIGVSAQKLNDELGAFISDNNESIIGLGQATSFNLELTPFHIQGSLIPIDLDKKGIIVPFDTVAITDYDSYSLIEVEARDVITNEVFPFIFKASLVSQGYETNINDNNVTGEVFLRICDFDITSLIKFWFAFKINDPNKNIRNYVIRTVLDFYDPYDIPFDIETAQVLDLKIWKDYGLRESSVSYTIEGYDNYGFVAIYNGQGPVELTSAEYGYSEVKALLRHSSGDEILVNLRGVRKTNCSTRTMNSTITCQSSKTYSQLILSFHPEDNEELKFDWDGTYRGIIPLQGRQRKSDTAFENILVNVWLRDLISDSEPEDRNLV